MEEIAYIRAIFNKEIPKTFGHEILYAKDCQELLVSIQQKTNRRISISTLKRVFGIIQSPHIPSKYSLDTLAIYLNYENWADLRNSFEGYGPIESERDYWALLKKRIQPVTKRSLSSMKAKLGSGFPDFKIREYAVQKFDVFLHSPHSATALIAPGGYGKTSIVTQLVEFFFTGPHARYPDDIVCLVDGSIMLNLLNLNLEVVRLKNIFDFEERNSFSVYFQKNPEQVRGRFVLIIDCLCQIYHQEEKLNSFVENLLDVISAYKDIQWFKLLITCKPDNWKSVSNLIVKDPDLISMWYGVQFRGSANDSINVPLLSHKEILYFLGKKHSAKWLEKFQYHFPELPGVLNNPFMLKLFSSNQKLKGIHSDLELLDCFISNEILLEPFLDEKSSIIDEFFNKCNFARHTSAVHKNSFVSSKEYHIAYKELIYNNVFFEYTTRSSYLSVNTYVKFSSDILMEYFLANKWIQKEGLDLALLKKVQGFYKDNPYLQTNILKNLIKIAFKEKDTEILKDLFSIFEGSDEGSSIFGDHRVQQELINTIGLELRKNKKIRDLLIPVFAESAAGQLFYFESFFDMDSLVLHAGSSIDHYLAHKHSEKAIIYGHFLKFMQYFLEGEQTSCKHEYLLFRSLKLSEHYDPAIAGYYYGAQLIYQSVFGDVVEENLLDDIHQNSELFFNEGIQLIRGSPVFEFIVLYSLNYGDCFKEIITISDWILKKYESCSSSPEWCNQLFRLILARALLNTGDTHEAMRLQRQIELRNVPVNYMYYVKMQFDLMVVEFLIYEGRGKEAKKLLKGIKNISLMIRYQYFYEKALMWEARLNQL